MFCLNAEQETEESLEPGDTQPKLSSQKSKQETCYLKIPKNFIDFIALFNCQKDTIVVFVYQTVLVSKIVLINTLKQS